MRGDGQWLQPFRAKAAEAYCGPGGCLSSARLSCQSAFICDPYNNTTRTTTLSVDEDTGCRRLAKLTQQVAHNSYDFVLRLILGKGF